MPRYTKLEDLQKFPIRQDHYDKENGNEHFVYGIETVLEYAENLPTCDVVPRSEVEELETKLHLAEEAFKVASENAESARDKVRELEKQLNDYKKFVGEIRVTSENHAVIIDTEHTEYIDKRVAEGLKNLAVKQAKQDVATKIFDFLINKKFSLLENKDLVEASLEFLDFIDNFIALTGDEILAEIEKKYIGE